ncbi:hypothetical protein ACFRAR_04310 [Kitasatospora sp. NPDC056651]|uniref:hypothetical protein n=1 Tax=Kitasatospora sp. NPDC056651 TaxID=3345892 RepID=UPI0036C9B2F0
MELVCGEGRRGTGGGVRRLVGGVLASVLVALCTPPAAAVTSAAAGGATGRDVSWDERPRSIENLLAGDRHYVENACPNWVLAGWPTGGDVWRNKSVGTWTGGVWYRGGGVFLGFRNSGKPLLDGWPGVFHEYDVQAYKKKPNPKDRGLPRLVRATAEGRVPIIWYSPDHYTKFQRLSDCA